MVFVETTVIATEDGDVYCYARDNQGRIWLSINGDEFKQLKAIDIDG